MESTTKAIEEENTQIIRLEKSVLAKTKKQEVTTFQSVLYKVLPDGQIEPSDPDSEKVSRNSIGLIWLSLILKIGVLF
ncbi:unnamed protein product [Moneuplotes crassus]|uniref:Uncharacterized protein n=1 Tax=Euplotes crassus TaxID=5936 RepID=A0AAD1UNF8_EUPCR|nr:unnamed protein product [Moneuplotes crassus]